MFSQGLPLTIRLILLSAIFASVVGPIIAPKSYGPPQSSPSPGTEMETQPETQPVLPETEPTTEDTEGPTQKQIWRAISLGTGLEQYNFRPRSIEFTGLSGTFGGSLYHTDPASWLSTYVKHGPANPITDRVLATTEQILIAEGFSVVLEQTMDPYHLLIGGNRIILDRRGSAAWAGDKPERMATGLLLAGLFAQQVWR
jgi:hypothetical protein